ncbi:hypothetical protein H5410_041238 [Solanum commersonii]|uniref:Uncharacterized protein n=1 Tax=Solanum commersonii TaxID=4109 RepID=A0A9J5XTY5_SOLCO|nr:hypothetical protein H5410_041238 [Solanum commersonii]
MGAGLKKDLRVSRVWPGGSLNGFFFLLIGVISQRLARVRKKGGTSTLGERSTTESFHDGLAAPGKRIEEAFEYFMYAPLGSGGYNSVGRGRSVPAKDSTKTKMGYREHRR